MRSCNTMRMVGVNTLASQCSRGAGVGNMFTTSRLLRARGVTPITPEEDKTELLAKLSAILSKPNDTPLNCAYLEADPSAAAPTGMIGKLFSPATGGAGISPPIPLILTAADLSEPVPLPLPQPLPPVTFRTLSTGAAAVNIGPSVAPKNTLVLDIDETLLHTSFDSKRNHVPLSEEAIEALRESEVQHPKQVGGAQSLIRPGLSEFLREVSDLYEVVFWTAGTSGYCAAVVNALERYVVGTRNVSYMFDPAYLRHFTPTDVPLEKRFSGVNYYALSRNQCLTGGSFSYLKYLPLLGRPLNKCLLIDDHPRSFRFTPRNAIKIKRFTGEPDTALADMLPMLRRAAAAEDVMVEMDHWRPNRYEWLDDFTTPNNLLGDYATVRRDTPIVPFADSTNNDSIRKEIAEWLGKTKKAPKA